MARSNTATAPRRDKDSDQHATSTEVGRNFGYYFDEALLHPVTIERHGEPRVVMLSLKEYHRLAALDRRAFHPSELDDEDYAALGRSRAKLAARERLDA